MNRALLRFDFFRAIFIFCINTYINISVRKDFTNLKTGDFSDFLPSPSYNRDKHLVYKGSKFVLEFSFNEFKVSGKKEGFCRY